MAVLVASVSLFRTLVDVVASEPVGVEPVPSVAGASIGAYIVVAILTAAISALRTLVDIWRENVETLKNDSKKHSNKLYTTNEIHTRQKKEKDLLTITSPAVSVEPVSYATVTRVRPHVVVADLRALVRAFCAFVDVVTAEAIGG